jgi:hypothetical protein
MNQKEALFTLQIAINRLAAATAVVLNSQELPDGNVTVSIGQNQEVAVIFKNGIVVYSRGNIANRGQGPIPPGYNAIFSPPYEPNGTQICTACGGSGRLP